MKLRLKTIRKINNYTQKDIAGILNITQRTYSKYETRELSFKIEQLITLSNFYKVSTDYLLGLADKGTCPVTSKTFNSNRLITNLKYLRYENNYSQKQLSDLINCSASLISMIERNKSNVQIDMLVSLAKVYHKTTDALLFSDLGK